MFFAKKAPEDFLDVLEHIKYWYGIDGIWIARMNLFLIYLYFDLVRAAAFAAVCAVYYFDCWILLISAQVYASKDNCHFSTLQVQFFCFLFI
jgi:hypothetical protein